MKVSEKLLNIRKEKALSQSEVAEKLGISRQTLSKWENGKSCPDAMFVKKICELYHLSIDDLLENQPYENSDKNSYEIIGKSKNKKPNRAKIILFLILADVLVCFLLVCKSRHMLFWVLNFNYILLIVCVLVWILYFIRDKMDWHKKIK